MIRRLYIYSLLLMSFFGYSQTELTTIEAVDLRASVLEKAQKRNSILSDFIQLKHLSFLSNDIESSGKLYYKAPNFIKWEYTTPFVYSAVFKGDILLINDGGKKSNLDLSSSKAFKSLNNLVVRSVKGDLFDATEFEISYFKDAQNYWVHFIPKDKKVKAFISEFVIGFDKKNHDVLSVKMLEDSEDYTLLIFKNQQFNQLISDEVFTN